MVEKGGMDSFKQASIEILILLKIFWGELKSAVGERNPANFQELEQIAKEQWEKMPADRCKKLINGCKKCLKAAVTASDQILRKGVFITVHVIFSASSLKLLHAS